MGVACCHVTFIVQTGKVIGRVSGYVKTQLIAHDKEVHDIAFTRAGGGRDLFASVGSDGSVRMFDLRYVYIIIIVEFSTSANK